MSTSVTPLRLSRQGYILANGGNVPASRQRSPGGMFVWLITRTGDSAAGV
jgi:hypothetical protein